MQTDPEELNRLRRLMAGLDPAGPPRACLVRCAPSGISGGRARLGILDASFNPMTLAHEQMAGEAQRACALDEVLLLLSRANVDKEVFGADLGQRLAMLLWYADGRPDTSVAGCSHARFVDKARALRPLYLPDTQFFFILGHDTLLRLFDPRYYADMQRDLTDLFAAARVVVANRSPHGVEEARAFMDRPECRPFADRCDFIGLTEPYASMSSTEVRRRRAAGQPIQDLVPGPVASAVEAMGLYLASERK